jgi:hypothetical protein
LKTKDYEDESKVFSRVFICHLMMMSPLIEQALKGEKRSCVVAHAPALASTVLQ